MSVDALHILYYLLYVICGRCSYCFWFRLLCYLIGCCTHLFPISQRKKSDGQCEQTVKHVPLEILVKTVNFKLCLLWIFLFFLTINHRSWKKMTELWGEVTECCNKKFLIPDRKHARSVRLLPPRTREFYLLLA